MAAEKLPFTWAEFDQGTGGRPLRPVTRRMLEDLYAEPAAARWRACRGLVVAPQMLIMGQTLWQCMEAVTLKSWPDGPDRATVSQPAMEVPSRHEIALALCYAAGLPHETARSRR